MTNTGYPGIDMGADQIGYLCSGPQELAVGPEMEAHIVTQLLLVLQWRDGLPADYDSEDLTVEQLDACPVALNAAEILNEPFHFWQLLEEFDADNEESDVRTANVVAWVHERLAEWPPETRDAVYQTDYHARERVMVFAGAMSWGDSPDGEGYLELQRLGHSGIASLVGIEPLPTLINLQYSPPERIRAEPMPRERIPGA